MKVAYVYPVFSPRNFEENLPFVSAEFGLYPPLGLAYAAGITEKAGHEAIIIDANALKLTKEETLGMIRKHKPDILGFMLTTYMFFPTLEWIRFLKKNTGLPVIAGNINMTLYPSETMGHKEIDFGIIGGANLPLTRFLQGKYLDAPGMAYRRAGKIIMNPPEEERFSDLPMPARHLLPNDRYYQFISQRKNFTIMMTSIGCSSACRFCCIRLKKYQERPVGKVLEEIGDCHTRHNVREIDFFDPSFTANRKRVMDICDGIIRKKWDLQWSCRARVDQVDETLLRKMREAGCCRVMYGIESGDDAILKKEGKGITLQKVKRALDMTRKNRMQTYGFFMIGQPGDTKESAGETIRLSMGLGLDFAQFSRTIAKPRTELDTMLVKSTGRDHWSEYVKGGVKEERLPAPWTSLTDDEITSLTKKAYFRFYFRPQQILRYILGIRSMDQLLRYCRVGVKALLFILKDSSREHTPAA